MFEAPYRGRVCEVPISRLRHIIKTAAGPRPVRLSAMAGFLLNKIQVPSEARKTFLVLTITRYRARMEPKKFLPTTRLIKSGRCGILIWGEKA